MRDVDRWADLIGMDDARLEGRLGVPTARHTTGRDVWLVFETAAGLLRVRCHAAPGGARAASWTLTLAEPARSLREAVGPLGLWPAAEPDADAGAVEQPLVRRALTSGGEAGDSISLTATVRGGRFTHLSVFDEPPDWL